MTKTELVVLVIIALLGLLWASRASAQQPALQRFPVSATQEAEDTSAQTTLTPEMQAVIAQAVAAAIIVQPVSPCSQTDLLKLINQLQQKGKKKDFHVTCGGVDVTWQEKDNRPRGCGWSGCYQTIPIGSYYGSSYGYSSYGYGGRYQRTRPSGVAYGGNGVAVGVNNGARSGVSGAGVNIAVSRGTSGAGNNSGGGGNTNGTWRN